MKQFFSTLSLLLVMTLAQVPAPPAHAQQFIEPTSPLGGNAAAPINGGTSTQRKLGSLIVGSSTTTSYLCLNSDSVVTSDPTKCISSWSQLRGNYVTLAQTDLSSIPLPTLNNHVVAPGRTADIGFARIQADGTKNQLYTMILEATGSASQPATALFATDGGVSSNYAAIFNGGVYIGDGTTSSAKKFCLNGNFTIDTTSGSPTYGKGCITSWSQLASFVPSASYVLLQTNTGTLQPQNGRVAVSGSATFASDTRSGLVIGAPPTGTPVTISCGDGICNGSEVSNPASCPSDCDESGPTNITLASPIVNASARTVTFNWTNPSDADFAGVRIVRTRSVRPTGPNDVTAEAVFTIPRPLTTFQNTSLSNGVNYYYGFYSYDTYNNYSTGVTQGIRLDACTSNCGPGGGGFFQ